jgi:HEAT repeats
MTFTQGGRRGSPPRKSRGTPPQPWPAAVLSLLLVLVAMLAPPRWAAHAGKLDELTRMLLEDDSYKVRVQAASLLGKLGDPAAAEPLTRALNDTNKTVRWMAAQSLARLGNPSAAPALKSLLARERDASVRTQAEKALAALGIRPGGPSGGGAGRIFLTFGSFSGGSVTADASALEVLRTALKRELGKLPSVTFENREAKVAISGSPVGFLIDGNVSRLDNGLVGGAMEINCDVKVMVARWPSKSIILWTNAGAAVQGGSRPQDIANARRDCLEASAGQLGEDLSRFFQSQGG